jgi:Carboxypeptidase regulatory-like domain
MLICNTNILKTFKILCLIVIIGIFFAYFSVPSSLADNYENDNSAETASTYYLFSTIYQAHDFYDQGDEDWIKFYTSEDFGAVEIKTYEPETNCETVITLFDTDKTTQLKEQNFTLSSGVSLMSFRPENEGTYYVRIKNKNSSNYGSDTGYNLAIYLPIAPFSGTVAGIVSDYSTGSPVEGVTMLIENDYAIATTESDGFYFLQCPVGNFTLYASKNGYADYSTDIEVIELGNAEVNLAINAINENCASLNSALTMTIPYVEIQGTCYQVTLEHYINPSDTLNLFWKLDINSIGTNQGCGSDCASMDLNLQITIPKIEFEGNFYQITLNWFSNPSDSSGFYWMLDLASITTI